MCNKKKFTPVSYSPNVFTLHSEIMLGICLNCDLFETNA